MKIYCHTLICFAALMGTSSQLAAEEPGGWGTLKGRFVFAGLPPKREVLELNKDIEFCMPLKPLDQELIVDPKTKGLKNVVLWLEPKTADHPIPVHSSYKKTAQEKVRLDNADCQFEPHICILRTTQTLIIGNEDKINHQAAVFFFNNDPFNENIPPGETVEKKLPQAENLPMKVTCPIHAWMIGYMTVKDHPYVAVTDAEGKFEIKNLPAGDWTIRVWHEKPGYIKEAKIAGRPQSWADGRAAVTIQAGDNDWGHVELSPELFKK